LVLFLRFASDHYRLKLEFKGNVLPDPGCTAEVGADFGWKGP